jgi:hypothetical protein
VIGLSPVVFGTVAPLERESDVFVDCPFQMRVGKVWDAIADVIAIVPGEVDGGEGPAEKEVNAGDHLRDSGIGKEGVGIEIGGETRLFAGVAVREEEIAEPDFDLLELLVAVLNGKNVVVVRGDSGAGEGFVFEVGLDNVMVAAELSLSMAVAPHSVREES